MKLLQLVRAYEVMGHFHAQLDPLGLDQRPKLPELDPAYYGFTDADMDRECVDDACLCTHVFSSQVFPRYLGLVGFPERPAADTHPARGAAPPAGDLLRQHRL